MAQTASGKDPTSALTRDRIKAIAGDLYVLHGYDGFSFGDIVDVIGTTRANIHHHFGSKQRLMAELIDGFTNDAAARIAHHWAEGDARFADRLADQLADLRRFYDRFNKKPGDRNVWSPLSRLRLDLPVLGDLASSALERVNRAYDPSLRQAIVKAIKAGEFVEETPVEEVARLIRVVLLSCAPMTQDTGSFVELEKLFAALGLTIEAAWGRPARKR
jgi:AcrR family transcriptional regulator